MPIITVDAVRRRGQLVFLHPQLISALDEVPHEASEELVVIHPAIWAAMEEAAANDDKMGEDSDEEAETVMREEYEKQKRVLEEKV